MAVAKQQNPQPFVSELEALILHRFPDARFRLTEIPDEDDGIAIWTYSAADPDEIRDLVCDREIEILVDHDIDIMTLPMPLEAWEN
jgi:hypothetical protein